MNVSFLLHHLERANCFILDIRTAINAVVLVGAFGGDSSLNIEIRVIPRDMHLTCMVTDLLLGLAVEVIPIAGFRSGAHPIVQPVMTGRIKVLIVLSLGTSSIIYRCTTCSNAATPAIAVSERWRCGHFHKASVIWYTHRVKCGLRRILYATLKLVNAFATLTLVS